MIESSEADAAKAAREAMLVKEQMAEQVTSTEGEVLKVINARKRASMKRVHLVEEWFQTGPYNHFESVDQ